MVDLPLRLRVRKMVVLQAEHGAHLADRLAQAVTQRHSLGKGDGFWPLPHEPLRVQVVLLARRQLLVQRPAEHRYRRIPSCIESSLHRGSRGSCDPVILKPGDVGDPRLTVVMSDAGLLAVPTSEQGW